MSDASNEGWRQIGIEVGEDLAARIDLGYLATSRSGHTVWPVIRRDALDPHSVILDLCRGAGALIIRAPGDHAFRLATGVLQRLALSMALDA